MGGKKRFHDGQFGSAARGGAAATHTPAITPEPEPTQTQLMCRGFMDSINKLQSFVIALKAERDELVEQKTTLDDACKHYQNALTAEQGKLQLKEEELGAANSVIIRIKSEAAAQTADFEVQKDLVKELQDKNQVPQTHIFPVLKQES